MRLNTAPEILAYLGYRFTVSRWRVIKERYGTVIRRFDGSRTIWCLSEELDALDRTRSKPLPEDGRTNMQAAARDRERRLQRLSKHKVCEEPRTRTRE